MGSLRVYRVVIESSNGRGRYQKEYVGPATSEDDAVEQAWTEDVATLPPDGDDWITS